MKESDIYQTNFSGINTLEEPIKKFNVQNRNDKILGKVPPRSLDLEMSVLGSIMLEKDALTTVIDILKPNSFYKEAHQDI